jgi:hypothetical protein
MVRKRRSRIRVNRVRDWMDGGLWTNENGLLILRFSVLGFGTLLLLYGCCMTIEARHRRMTIEWNEEQRLHEQKIFEQEFSFRPYQIPGGDF